MAYNSLHMGSGLFVYAIQPGKKRTIRVIPQHAGSNGAGGTVAWSKLDICRVGRIHGLLLIGYRLFDRATVGTPIDRVMKQRWFVPFSIGAMFAAFVLSAAFFRPKTLQTSGHVLSALLGFQHVTGEFLLTTGTIVLIFISLFLAAAQERSQFIDRLAL